MSPRTLSGPAKLYVFAVIVAGSATVIASAYELFREPLGYRWLILAALTLFSGSASVKLPSIPASLSVSETFVITSVLLFGAPVGTLIVALDGLIISLWLNRGRKEAYRLLFNMCAPALSIWVSAQLFFYLSGIRPLVLAPAGILEFIVPLIAFTVLYFLINSWLIAFAVAFETGQSAFHIWNSNLLWLSLNFFCGASVSTFFLTIFPQFTVLAFFAYVAAILPLLLVLYFTYSTSMARVADANRHLGEMNQMYLATIETLALAVDAKDQVTHGHIRRVQSYAVALTRRLAGSDPGLLHAMEAASLLHDMGKLAVPEHILNKPGKLSAAEFDRMKLHASMGADILSSIHFPYPVIPIVRHHHESWNGSGYPDGLSGTAIPLGARILAVIDCYDALTSDRPYRPRLSMEQALGILVERRGSMYDPLIVDAFVQHITDSATTTDHFRDGDNNSTVLELARRIAQNSQNVTPRRIGYCSPHRSARFIDLCSAIHEASFAPNLKVAMTKICPSLRSLVAADLLVLFVYDPHCDDLIVEFSHGVHAEEVYAFRVALGTRLAGWVGATRQPALNSSPALDFDASSFEIKDDLLSCLMVPLLLDEALVGTLGLYSRQSERYTSEDQECAVLLSGHIASMLVNGVKWDEDRAASRQLSSPSVGS
jgi:HD-GYP domain-containing protein (c-di-GMP phosphodiesterase class II)